ncbi:hypothetical protein [Acuticoccus yangtzensis]|uniref:hypothetical protein n=1 Tax=Acuticoccus yangtzensis TaxID=1443441 RepID=UPI000A67A28A|nr:hypothetical protein [Acuticoccus yangtzensis]
MLRDRIIRMLERVLGAEAHDPDPTTMNAMERAEAISAMRKSGAGMVSEFADATESARQYAREANQTGQEPMEGGFVDDSEDSRTLARAASEKDGSYLESDLVDDNWDAEEEAEIASPANMPVPRSDLIDSSAGAREAAIRASEKSFVREEDDVPDEDEDMPPREAAAATGPSDKDEAGARP